MSCPYQIGDTVTWQDNVPATWKFIITPGPLVVVGFWWMNGEPTPEAMKFDGGFDFKPGWVIVVEYDADSTDYYNPRLSLLLGAKRIKKDIHEMWLKKAS